MQHHKCPQMYSLSYCVHSFKHVLGLYAGVKRELINGKRIQRFQACYTVVFMQESHAVL